MKKSKQTHVIWLVLIALLAAALACGPVSGGMTPDTGSTGNTGNTGKEQPPTLTPLPEPTDAPPTEAPPPTDTPPSGITPDNAADLDIINLITADEAAILAAASSPINHEVATFNSDGSISLFDADTGEYLTGATGHSQNGFAMAYSPDGTMIATGGGDFRVRVWDAGNLTQLSEVIVNADPYRIIWAPDNSAYGVVGEGSSRMEFYDPFTGENLGYIRPSARVLWSAAISPDGNLIATADNAGQVSIFDLDSGDFSDSDTTTAQGAGWDLEYSPDGRYLASCNDGGGVYIWDVATFSVVLSGVVYNEDCVDGVFGQNSRLYFTAGDDGYIFAWDVETGDKVGEVVLPYFVYTITASGDNEEIAASSEDGTLVIIGLP